MTTLHSFDYGAYSYAGLVLGTDGSLYGTTYQGGAGNAGTVFKIAPGNRLTTLHSFDSTDGAWPFAALVQDTNGIVLWNNGIGGATAMARSSA